MKISKSNLKRLIREEFRRLVEDDSYKGKENINIPSSQHLFDNGWLLDTVETGQAEIEMARDPSLSPEQYINKDYSPLAKDKIFKIKEPFVNDLFIKRFERKKDKKLLKNKYPGVYQFLQNLSQSDPYDKSGEKVKTDTLDLSVAAIFDAESLYIYPRVVVTDNVVQKDIVLFNGILYTIGESRGEVRDYEDSISSKYDSYMEQYRKNPSVIEFPNGNHTEAAKWIDQNTNIKIPWVSDYDSFLLVLPIYSRSKLDAELSISGFEYNIQNK